MIGGNLLQYSTSFSQPHAVITSLLLLQHSQPLLYTKLTTNRIGSEHQGPVVIHIALAADHEMDAGHATSRVCVLPPLHTRDIRITNYKSNSHIELSILLIENHHARSRTAGSWRE